MTLVDKIVKAMADCRWEPPRRWPQWSSQVWTRSLHARAAAHLAWFIANGFQQSWI